MNKLDANTFMGMLVKYMNDAHQLNHMIGLEKKEFVLKQLRNYMDEATYERYHEMISVVINGIVSIDKKELVLAIYQPINVCLNHVCQHNSSIILCSHSITNTTCQERNRYQKQYNQ